MPSATSIDFRLVLVGLVLGIIAINPPTLSFLPFLRNGSLHSSTNAHAQSRMRPLYSDDLAEDIGSVDGSPPAKDFLQRAEQPQPASLSLSEQPRYHELPLYVLNAAASAEFEAIQDLAELILQDAPSQVVLLEEAQFGAGCISQRLWTLLEGAEASEDFGALLADHCPPSTLATTRVHDQLSLAGATISSMSLPAPQEKSWATPDAHKLAKLLRQSRPEVCFVAFVPKVTKSTQNAFLHYTGGDRERRLEQGQKRVYFSFLAKLAGWDVAEPVLGRHSGAILKLGHGDFTQS